MLSLYLTIYLESNVEADSYVQPFVFVLTINLRILTIFTIDKVIRYNWCNKSSVSSEYI